MFRKFRLTCLIFTLGFSLISKAQSKVSELAGLYHIQQEDYGEKLELYKNNIDYFRNVMGVLQFNFLFTNLDLKEDGTFFYSIDGKRVEEMLQRIGVNKKNGEELVLAETLHVGSWTVEGEKIVLSCPYTEKNFSRIYYFRILSKKNNTLYVEMLRNTSLEKAKFIRVNKN